jgi:hypothetical protein
MKKKIFVIILFMLAAKLNFSQEWQWAKHIGSDYSMYGERISSLITDGTYFYAIGSYGGTLYLPNDTLYCNGNNDIFITKIDSNGNQIWAKTLGGNYSQPDALEHANGVYDPVNNCIYVAGTFINSINFGNGVNLNSIHLNDADIFVARMDLNGIFIWAKRGGSSGNDDNYVYAEPDGDILMTGKLSSSGNIDTTYIAAGGFMARYGSDGNLKWAAHKFTGPENYKISISFIGTDIVMGGFYDLNPTIIDTVMLIPNNSIDGYLTRMDSLGNVKWIKTFGNSGTDGVGGIAGDNSDYIYITGEFINTIDLGGISLSNNGKDILIAKYNQNGNIIWAKQAFISGEYAGSSGILADNYGNSYIVGNFSGSALFGSYNVSTLNTYDMFLARFDSSGFCLGITHFGQASGSGLAQNNYNNIICSGAFRNTVNIGNNTFTSYGLQDIFIAKTGAIVGIEELKAANNNTLLIYANPTTGKCTVTVPDDFLNAQDLMLSIFDNTGKIIQQQKIEMNEGKIKIDLEQEAKGIYNVTLGNGKKVYGGRIVFQ